MHHRPSHSTRSQKAPPRRGAPSLVKISRHESKGSLLGGDHFNAAYPAPNVGFRERQGYEAVPPRGKGPSKMYWPNTPWTWTFLGIVVVQAIIIIALESYASTRTLLSATN